MSNNDSSLMTTPSIQCPECEQYLPLSRERIFAKFSAEQLKRRSEPHMRSADIAQETRKVMAEANAAVGLGSGILRGLYENSALPPDDLWPERKFVLVSCENERCGQYLNFKVLEMPRIAVKAAKVE